MKGFDCQLNPSALKLDSRRRQRVLSYEQCQSDDVCCTRCSRRHSCRHGHNELDNPQATLPLTYKLIQDHPSVLSMYASRLEERGIIQPGMVADMRVSAFFALS